MVTFNFTSVLVLFYLKNCWGGNRNIFIVFDWLSPCLLYSYQKDEMSLPVYTYIMHSWAICMHLCTYK